MLSFFFFFCPDDVSDFAMYVSILVCFFLSHFQDCTFASSFKVQAQHLFALSLFSN